MTWFQTINRSAVWIVLALMAASVRPATAADLLGPDGNPILGRDGYPVRQTSLESACSASLLRFCPEYLNTPGQTRNEVICLKPYRTSLPFYCRAAVTGAMKK